MLKRNLFALTALAISGLTLWGNQASAFNETSCSWNVGGKTGSEYYPSTTTLMNAGLFYSDNNVHLFFETDPEGDQNNQQYIIRGLILDQHAIKTGVGPKNIRIQSPHFIPKARGDKDLYDENAPQPEPEMGSTITLNEDVALSSGKTLKISAQCVNSYGD